MITIRGSVDTPLGAKDAFAFLSAFENTPQWDPGTPVVEKLSSGPVAVDHRYQAQAQFNGKRQPIEYEVMELSDRHMKLRGDHRKFVAYDSIDVHTRVHGSQVTYTAEFSLKGPAKLIEPLLKPVFMRLRDPAVNGLHRRSDSLASTRPGTTDR